MNEFKLIVAGGRDFNEATQLHNTLHDLANGEYLDHQVSIVSGMARGADALAYQFAKKHGVKCYEFPANWDDLKAPGAVTKKARDGHLYNANAGFARNKEMGDFADGLLAFWDGTSPGTKQMIDYMRKLGKPVHVENY